MRPESYTKRHLTVMLFFLFVIVLMVGMGIRSAFAATSVNSISVTIPEPTVGGSIETAEKGPGSLVANPSIGSPKLSILWLDYTGKSGIPAKGTFKKGGRYRVQVSFEIPTGYEIRTPSFDSTAIGTEASLNGIDVSAFPEDFSIHSSDGHTTTCYLFAVYNIDDSGNVIPSSTRGENPAFHGVGTGTNTEDPTGHDTKSPTTSTNVYFPTRLGAANRYATMQLIVSTGFKTSDCAVVATGESYPDALAASSLAGAKGCPVILTKGNSLSPEASSLIKSLGVKKVYLMGGDSATSSAVLSTLEALNVDVTRESGDSRYDTALASYTATRQAGSKSDTVIVATGKSFADALSIGPWAWVTKSPIVLTGADGKLSDKAVSTIKSDTLVRRVIIVGGTAVVSEDVKSQLGTYSYLRLAGANRYETSKAVAEFGIANGLSWKNPVVTTGRGFADALAGAALAGKNASVLLLADSPDDPTVAYAAANRDKIGTGFVLGGTSAVSDEVMAALG